MRRHAKTWQRSALGSLLRHYRHGGLAALLQLPTGLGKTLVAVRAYQALAGNRPSLRLVVCVAGRVRSRRDAWSRDLQHAQLLTGASDIHEWDHGTHERVAWTTHRKLARFIREKRAPRASAAPWMKWIHGRRAFIVVDEVHRIRLLRDELCNALEGRKQGRWGGTRIFRRRGPRPRAPLWLLLSATPYNPVALDYQLDKGPRREASHVADEDREYQEIVGEVGSTWKMLAFLERADAALVDRIDRYLSEALHEGSRPVTPPRALHVVPRDVSHLRPATAARPPPSRSIRLSELSVASAQLIATYERIVDDRITDPHGAHRNLIERLVLGGARCVSGEASTILGHRYGRATVRGVRRASAGIIGGVEPEKIAAVAHLVERLNAAGQKAVVFCVHRAVTSAVRRRLARLFPRESGAIWCPADELEPADAIKQFGTPGVPPWVVVATDALSESVDLHGARPALIHYELPWSPLRILQRFGRLWRIHGATQVRTSRAPTAYHVVHPFGLEEEILCRLRRRWRYLAVLGLDYLSERAGLGSRVPSLGNVGPGWNETPEG